MDLPIRPSRQDIYDFISYKHGLKDAAKGKHVLITGAGTGIGKNIAAHFALAGASTLFLAGRRTAPLQETKDEIKAQRPDCDVRCICTDVANQSSVEILFASIDHLDILINNAGGAGDRTTVADSDPQKWWQGFETNVKGTYLVTRMFLRVLQGAPGVIINVSTRSSYVTGPTTSSYGCSKTALNRFTEYVAQGMSSLVFRGTTESLLARDFHDRNGRLTRMQDLPDQKVRCIAMHPGGVPTELSLKAPAWVQPMLVDKIDLPAATALYLSTQRAAFLNGRYVDSRWDMEELERYSDRIEREDLLKTRIHGLSES